MCPPAKGEGYMKNYSRTKRISTLIQHELAQCILQYPNIPIFKTISITEVRVSPDLSHAKIFFSIYDETKVSEALAALNSESKQLRHLLAQNLNLRITPQLFFVYDKSIIEGNRLAKLIDDAVAKDDEIK